MGRDLHLPDAVAPTGAAVVLHPHPGMGGDRHHPVVIGIADGLAAHGIAALRIDLTDPDPQASTVTLREVTEDLVADLRVDRLVLAGYSWGSIVASLVEHAALDRRVLVAPPVSMLVPAVADGIPTLVLVPAHDQFGPPDAVQEAMGERPDTTIELVEGADHFLAGAAARVASRAVEWLTGAP